MTPKYKSTNQTRKHQSALGRYEHGGVGHSHDRPGAEGEDGVVPPLVVLLLPGRTSPRRGPYWDQSLITETLLIKILCLYIEQITGLFALDSFLFHLTLVLICTSPLIKLLNKPNIFQYRPREGPRYGHDHCTRDRDQERCAFST